jgi:hypothetical protein
MTKTIELELHFEPPTGEDRSIAAFEKDGALYAPASSSFIAIAWGEYICWFEVPEVRIHHDRMIAAAKGEH